MKKDRMNMKIAARWLGKENCYEEHVHLLKPQEFLPTENEGRKNLRIHESGKRTREQFQTSDRFVIPHTHFASEKSAISRSDEMMLFKLFSGEERIHISLSDGQKNGRKKRIPNFPSLFFSLASCPRKSGRTRVRCMAWSDYAARRRITFNFLRGIGPRSR